MGGLKKLINSFRFAFAGFRYCLFSEQNFRIHITIMLYVLYFSTFYKLSATDYGVLILTFAIVLCSEMFNTALEKTIDLVSPAYHHLAKIVKDISAGAVLLSAVAAVAVGFLFFFDTSVFMTIIDYFTSNLVNLLLFIIAIILSVLFIFQQNPK